jgi:asparagine synthase (glutamine-hydrolysing)
MADEEGRYAKLVAEQAGLPIHFLAISLPDRLDESEGEGSLFPATPEPGSILALEPQFVMARQAAGHSRILISGMGGDPLLFPSRNFLAGLVRRGQVGRLSQALALHWRLHGRLPPLYLRSALRRRRPGSSRPLPGWLNAAFAARIAAPARWAEINLALETLDQRRGMLTSPFWQNLFAHSDPGYARLPLKLRYPFFDLRLFLFVLSVPPVPWFVGKTLLREAMRGALPEAVRQRPKTPAAGSALRASAGRQPPAWMQPLAAVPELEPYVNRAALAQLAGAPAPDTPAQFQGLFAPLALAHWLRRRRSVL